MSEADVEMTVRQWRELSRLIESMDPADDEIVVLRRLGGNVHVELVREVEGGQG